MYTDDRTRIRHMPDAAHYCFVKSIELCGLRFDKLSARLLTQRPPLAELVEASQPKIALYTIVGEASSRISEGFKSQHPEIPWKQMAAMRNRLIHGYFTIDPDIVWNTAKTELPELVPLLRKLAME